MQKTDADKVGAGDMKRKAMERLSETWKRKEGDDEYDMKKKTEQWNWNSGRLEREDRDENENTFGRNLIKESREKLWAVKTR